VARTRVWLILRLIENEGGLFELGDFSDDEAVTFFLSGIAAVVTSVFYYYPLFTLTALGGGRMIRVVLASVPVVCLEVLGPPRLAGPTHRAIHPTRTRPA